MDCNKCRISWIVSTIRGIWILQCVRSLDTDNPFICFPISCTFEFFLIWWYICIGLILNHEEDTLLHIRKHALARVCCLLCILSSPTTTIHSQQVKDRCNTVVLKVDGMDGWISMWGDRKYTVLHPSARTRTSPYDCFLNVYVLKWWTSRWHN